MDRVGNFFMIKTHGKMLLMKKSFARLHPPWISERNKVDRMYHLRDVSEKQYMIIKFQPGYDATRVHSTEEIENKFYSMLHCFHYPFGNLPGIQKAVIRQQSNDSRD